MPEPAEQGRLVGQVEVVETGEVVDLQAVEDLVALIRRLATEQVDEGRRPVGAPAS